MRTMLLPFHDDTLSDQAAATVLMLARGFGAYVEGLFVHRPPQIIAGEGITIPADYVSQLADDGRARASQAHARFDALMRAHDVKLQGVDVPCEGPSAGWREMEGLEGEIIGDYGRLFDLIAIARHRQPASTDWNVMCEAALFDSGRPILLCPEGEPRPTLGRNVLIAWNGSTETARCIALAMPLLHRAEQVLVLQVEGGTVLGPSHEQVATHLARNGVPARSTLVANDGRAIGEVILGHATECGADLLVKGAYTQSRLRQMIFGGATRHILTEATLPVFMAH